MKSKCTILAIILALCLGLAPAPSLHRAPGADTDTLTIAAETIFGFSVASQTSVETMS